MLSKIMGLLLALTLMACTTATNTPAPQPTSANTPAVVENTPAPVNTLAPTATATFAPPTMTSAPPPTDTPVAPPTPDPNEGVGDVVFADPLDGTGGWYWTYVDEAATFGVSLEQKQLNTVAHQSNTWRFVISNDTVSVGDQQIRVTAHTNVCADNDEYALLLRGAADTENTYSFYALKLRCSGAVRLELLRGANTTVLVDWTPTPAMRPGVGADNTLILWAVKDQFRVYLNDQYVFSAQDATLSAGFYGFYLYDRTNANLSVSWKGLEVRAVRMP